MREETPSFILCLTWCPLVAMRWRSWPTQNRCNTSVLRKIRARKFSNSDSCASRGVANFSAPAHPTSSRSQPGTSFGREHQRCIGVRFHRARCTGTPPATEQEGQPECESEGRRKRILAQLWNRGRHLRVHVQAEPKLSDPDISARSRPLYVRMAPGATAPADLALELANSM